MMKGKASVWLGNIVILLVAISFALIAIEFGLRIALGHAIVLFPRNHAEAQYGPYVLRSMTPNTVFWHQSVDGRWRFETNNKGFRDKQDYRYLKPKGLLRVLVLGDSHTVGFEVDQEDTFASILERELQSRGFSAEVLNTGVSGMGTAEQLAFLENEGLRYDPDIVIVAFFANDYSDSMRAGLFQVNAEALSPVSFYYAPGTDILEFVNAVPGVKWLSENSYAYSYVFNAVWRYFKVRSIRRARDGIDKASTPSTALEQAVADGGVTETEQALVIKLLNRIARLGQENEAISVLVDIPAVVGKNTVHSSLEPETRSAVLSSFDYVLSFEDYLADGTANEMAHVPNGHRHISAYTHHRLGEALAELFGNSADAKRK